MINAPEQEQAANKLEQIKNQITMGELEVKRLQGLAAGEEYKLSDLAKSKEDHQARIVEAQTQLNSHAKDLKALEDEISTVSKMLEAGRTEVADLEKRAKTAKALIQESDLKLAEAQKQVGEVEAKVADAHQKLDEREKVVVAREANFKVKLARIKEVTNALTGV